MAVEDMPIDYPNKVGHLPNLSKMHIVGDVHLFLQNKLSLTFPCKDFVLHRPTKLCFFLFPMFDTPLTPLTQPNPPENLLKPFNVTKMTKLIFIGFTSFREIMLRGGGVMRVRNRKWNLGRGIRQRLEELHRELEKVKKKMLGKGTKSS